MFVVLCLYKLKLDIQMEGMKNEQISKKMTNEEIMKEFESVAATLYDYSNQTSLKLLKQPIIERIEKNG